jgi:hypothetical protein
MRSRPVSSPMSASRGDPGSHIRYRPTASALVRTPAVLPTSNGLPHLWGRATEMAPSGFRQPGVRRCCTRLGVVMLRLSVSWIVGVWVGTAVVGRRVFAEASAVAGNDHRFAGEDAGAVWCCAAVLVAGAGHALVFLPFVPVQPSMGCIAFQCVSRCATWLSTSSRYGARGLR